LSKEWRPWGYYEVLYSDEQTWLKRLVIDAGKRLSSQRHSFRREFWQPLQNGGYAVVNGVRLDLIESMVYDVPVGVIHRICNDTNEQLYILEWAVGKPIESDIERLEDDYGR
jgi:mannose-6-phosphate isomerase-like protein (cupin superfamily)